MTRWIFSRGLALGGRLVALLGTSYFLIATSAPYKPVSSQTCSHAAQVVTIHVTGTCGPEGDITVTSQVDDCAIAVQGANNVGLPSAGRFDRTGTQSVSLSESAWTLSGYLPESTTVSASDGGIFTVVLDARSSTDLAVVPDAGVFSVVRDAQAAIDLGSTADTGVFTVVRDAQIGMEAGASPSGAGGSPSTATSHGKIVSRTCYRPLGTTSSDLSCYDNSTYTCEAILTAR